MFGRRQKEETKLEIAIDSLLSEMSTKDSESKEYTAMAKNLEVLHRIKDGQPSNKVSADTKAVIAGNLVGLILVLNYEQMHVLSTKALGFVIRGRV